MQSENAMRRRWLIWIVIAILVFAYAYVQQRQVENAAQPVGGETAVLEAFHAQRSGVVVEVTGRVRRVLDDDREGSRHQRFLIELASGHTLLVSHNIDLASRVEDIAVGDDVEARGQYEWNDRGGVLHWTHHDPKGRRPGGWIRHRGATYR